MPVDLRALPEKQELPPPPGLWRWSVLVSTCALFGAGLAVWLWPAAQPATGVWFWCCVVVFPLMGGALLLALRRVVYERQVAFAQHWNQVRDVQEQALIEKGQRALALVAASYCTAAGTDGLAQALGGGIAPLQPVYLPTPGTTLRVSQLSPEAEAFTLQECGERLQIHLQKLVAGLAEALQRCAGTAPVRVRIKHNNELGDDQVLALWQQCSANKLVVEQVLFATLDDGVLWLDAWLDDPTPPSLWLSLEFNVFVQPVAEQAESVSAVLLALPEWIEKHTFSPPAWVHRPVAIITAACSLQDVLCWGRVEAGIGPCFVWLSQVPADSLGDISAAMHALGRPLAGDSCLRLDDALGRPGSAVGNITLIVASERAASENQVQLILLQDASAHGCVVRPAAALGNDEP